MAKTPGKNHREGITFKQLLRKFPTAAKAEEWIVKQRWARGVCCPHCGSLNVQTGCQHKTMPFRCRERICAKRFSTKTGTVMEGSKIGYQDWIVAAFLVMTSLKSVSSMKLHRDLGITQKSAWFLAQRLRAALSEDSKLFSGPVEVDETYLGGKRKNMSNAKRKELADTGRGPVGKTAVGARRTARRIRSQRQSSSRPTRKRCKDSSRIMRTGKPPSTPTMRRLTSPSRSTTTRSSTR